MASANGPFLFEVGGRSPRVDESAVLAPTAVLSGGVTVAAGAHISFGAVLIAEDAPVSIGTGVVIRENVVVRSAPGHPVEIGAHVLVGAGSALYGCKVEDEVFLATRATVFHGARIGPGSEVRINGVVHVNTRLNAGAIVPIGWVAVGDPATVLPPDEHDAIWEIQRQLDFPGTAYGVGREPDGRVDMRKVVGKAAPRGHRGWKPVD